MTDTSTVPPRCPECNALVDECACGNMITLDEALKIVEERWSKYTRAQKRAWLAAHPRAEPTWKALIASMAKPNH